MENVFPSSHPLIASKLTLLRDVTTEPKKFRELVRELSAMLAYEATLDLAVQPNVVQTPLTTTQGVTLTDRIGLVPVLRAGLGMVEGVWELMPGAEVCPASWRISGRCRLNRPASVGHHARVEQGFDLGIVQPGFAEHGTCVLPVLGRECVAGSCRWPIHRLGRHPHVGAIRQAGMQELVA